MFPDSPLAHPVSSFQNPVPLVTVDPDSGTLVSVCFNPAWLPYVIGSLKQLLLQTTWDTSDSSDLALVQERATNLIGLFQDGLCTGGAEVQTILRSDPSGCGVQWSVDNGDTWNTIDLSSCIADLVGLGISNSVDEGIIQGGSAQQPPQPRPEPTICNVYHVFLNANDAWVCPNPIATGDTITVDNAKGATNDGSGFGAIGPWFCPDGKSYGLGTCSGDGSTDSGDPLPTVNHMAIVAYDSANWFDPTTTYVVPAGITNGQLNIQMNDSSLGDNLGSLTFDVTVCIGDTGPWCHDFDFTDGEMHGWTLGHGTAQEGGIICEQGTIYGEASSTIDLQLVIPSVPELSQFEMIYDCTVTTCVDGPCSEQGTGFTYNDTAFFMLRRVDVMETGNDINDAATITGNYSKLVVYLRPSAGDGTYSGRATLKHIRLSGPTGPNPFGANNCEG
jgi:hypothetical protein